MSNKRRRVNRNENYRIIIIPWPAYTDAFKTTANIKRGGGGNLIEGDATLSNLFSKRDFTFLLCNVAGHLKVTEYGPRIYWKKHHLSDMPVGYGGCYVIQKMSNNVIDMRFSPFFLAVSFFFLSDNACSYIWWKANRSRQPWK